MPQFGFFGYDIPGEGLSKRAVRYALLTVVSEVAPDVLGSLHTDVLPRYEETADALGANPAEWEDVKYWSHETLDFSLGAEFVKTLEGWSQHFGLSDTFFCGDTWVYDAALNTLARWRLLEPTPQRLQWSYPAFSYYIPTGKGQKLEGDIFDVNGTVKVTEGELRELLGWGDNYRPHNLAPLKILVLRQVLGFSSEMIAAVLEKARPSVDEQLASVSASAGLTLKPLPRGRRPKGYKERAEDVIRRVSNQELTLL